MNKKLKIDVLANDGSPLGVTEQSIYGLDGSMGVGGAELGIMTLCSAWQAAGHDVTFYNNPRVPRGSTFKHAHISAFIPAEDRDILIIFRSPNVRVNRAKGLKVWFSTDQYTVGNFKDFAGKVDKIVTISDFHANHFRSSYGIEDTITIDLPVRTWEYKETVEKIPHSLIFCSVPDRGLAVLAEMYDEICGAVPQVTLTITSDYRLWGVESPRNEQYVRRFLGKSGVRFLGAIPRQQMIAEQQRATIQAYPCTYEELFCYAVAECQVAGAVPITSNIGALSTTNMAVQVQGSVLSREWRRTYIDTLIKQLQNESLPDLANYTKQRAVERFSVERIMKEWEEKVFHG